MIRRLAVRFGRWLIRWGGEPVRVKFHVSAGEVSAERLAELQRQFAGPMRVFRFKDWGP